MAFTLGMTVDVGTAYMIMLASMTLTVMHVDSESAKGKQPALL